MADTGGHRNDTNNSTELPMVCDLFCMFASGLIGPLLVYEIYCRFIPENRFLNAMIGAKK